MARAKDVGPHRHGICRRNRFMPRVRRTILFASFSPFKYNYDELEGTKDKEGHDREASVSKSAGKMKRKVEAGGSNDNAKDKEGHDREASVSKSAGKMKRKVEAGGSNDNASSFGLLVQGDDDRAMKVAKRSLVTSKDSKEAQIDGKGSVENEGC